MRLPELLAPAGSFEALKAAISAGADAVYLGGKRFGARKFAANFDDPKLKEAVDYAHLRGVKAYITVNTLVLDRELHDVARYLLWLYEIGADAVLVQDAGVARICREVVPGLDLHASTQMTIHNLPGALWAQKQGMKRVVLSREVSLQEAEKIGQKVEIGLEIFIHGALCYCYSGQCLLSSVMGGRSGNRGMCAQPCRKPYVLLSGEKDEYGRPINLAVTPLKDRFLMSTRDLAVYSHLDRIVRSPVVSLKIEGRMKSAEYVAVVTSIYRRALDALAKGSWAPSKEEMRDLALAFNRAFTEGYLLSSEEIMGREMSDNRGVLAGTVVSYDAQKKEAAIRLSGILAPEMGDGLVFISLGQEVGMVVSRQPYLKDGYLRLKIPQRIKPGSRMYITNSKALSRSAKTIASADKARVPLDLKVSFQDKTPVIEARLWGSKGEIRVKFRSGFEMEEALSSPLTARQIESQLKKTGGTPFLVDKIDLDYPGGLFAPLAALNRLRRDFLARAEEALQSSYRPSQTRVEEARDKLKNFDLNGSSKPTRMSPSLGIYADSIEVVSAASDGGCKRVYYEPRLTKGRQMGWAQTLLSLLNEAKEVCGSANLVWKWPRITRDGHLELAAVLAAKAQVDGIMVDGIGAAEAAVQSRPGVRLYGSCGLNVWNHQAAKQLSPPFSHITLSSELSAAQLYDIVSRSRIWQAPAMEILVQGNLEVMVTEDCLLCLAKDEAEFWGLQDFKRVFPVIADDDLRTHILNSVETCLIDHMPRILDLGLDGIAIDARERTERYAREMVELYSLAIKITEKGGRSLREDLEALKNEARLRSLGGITSGNFVKGLKEEL